MFPIPTNEPERLAAVRALGLIGTAPEPHFDAVCRTAQALFAVPICTVSLIEEHEQWFKAQCGLNVAGTSREISFCAHAILSDAVFVVEDARLEPRFSANPLVTGEPHIRFYAGAPLVLRPGLRVGTLCVIDTQPRAFSPGQRQQLQDLAEVIVAHLRLHEALRASDLQGRLRERAEIALDHMRQGLVMLDAAQRVMLFNARASEVLGLSDAVLHQGAAFADIRAFQRARGDFSLVGDTIRNRVAGSDLCHLPSSYEWPRPEGTTLEVNGARLPDGKFVYTFTDITARKVTEAALTTSEMGYRLLAENTSDVIIQCDRDMTWRYVSPAITAVLGYGPGDLIGTHPIDLVHPGDVDAHRRVLDGLSQDRVARAVSQQRHRHRQGGWVWTEISFALTRDGADGRATGYVASLRDISARKAAEEAAAASEARYREAKDTAHDAILAQLAEGVIVTDTAGRITLVNDAAAAIHGVSRLDIEPDDYSTTYHLYTEEGLPFPSQDLPLARAVRGEIVQDARWRVRRPDGTEILAIGSARPLRGSDGQGVGAVLTLRDDTARGTAELSLRESEAALRELNATLTQRVDARTRDAEAARLEAERASQAKTDFLAAMSHEIRTPLNAIIGFTDLMAGSGRLDHEMQRQAELVRTSGEALLTVVNDILDFSKVEAGAIELIGEPFLPYNLIDNCLSIVRSLAAPKSLDIRADIDGKLPLGLLGDQARLQQILLNLLNNAIKFTKAGSVTLRVHHEGTTAKGERLRFSVTDTGIGIAPDKQARLFQKFSQVDNSIQREFGGTGLGLAICKRLVELMGGEIGVLSDEGWGSTFWFSVTLPRALAPEPMSPAAGTPVDREPGYLLLVEDVEINQTLARAVLEAAGHRVEVVGDGAAAVAAVEHTRYDLVLMDVQMPGMDGLTATRLIRSLPTPTARVPIIAMTANVMPEQIRGIRDVGMNDHVGKPFTRAELYAKIDRWLPTPAERAAPGASSVSIAGAFDHAAFEAVATLLTPARLAAILSTFADDLDRSFVDPVLTADDRYRIRYEAHATVSTAGMIGFTPLARACKLLEGCGETANGTNLFETSLNRVRQLAASTAIAARQLAEARSRRPVTAR